MIPVNPFRPSRRRMLQTASCGFGYLAMSALASASSLVDRPSPVAPRAKRVIFLCMSGGPANLDMFDYKPQTGQKKHAGSVFPFRQHGQSGHWMSSLIPNLARHADKLCVLNAMYSDTSNHSQSFLQLHTGDRLRPRPSMGAWISYGLGTENQNLPGFVSLNTSKPAVYSSVFLPPAYEGTPIGVNGEDMSKATIPNIASDHLPVSAQRRQLDLIQTINRAHLAGHSGDERLESVIETMELGFRMQATAPALLDISKEPAAVLERYRVGKQKTLGTCKQTDFGRQCLLARRLAEAGVRFIELNHGSWDQHKNHREELTANCEATDAPIAALLEDLDQRGLLEETLVVWGGEFGRPGLTPEDGKNESGHNNRCFTFWLAGGGVKAGHQHGRTNETGSTGVEGRVHFRDLHATIFHLMGLDHERLSYRYGGREFRLTGTEKAQVVREILA